MAKMFLCQLKKLNYWTCSYKPPIKKIQDMNGLSAEHHQTFKVELTLTTQSLPHTEERGYFKALTHCHCCYSAV